MMAEGKVLAPSVSLSNFPEVCLSQSPQVSVSWQSLVELWHWSELCFPDSHRLSLWHVHANIWGKGGCCNETGMQYREWEKCEESSKVREGWERYDSELLQPWIMPSFFIAFISRSQNTAKRRGEHCYLYFRDGEQRCKKAKWFL